MVYPKTTMAQRLTSEVQSVTSNSKSSEDEYSQEGRRELDSTDDEGVQSRVNGLHRRSKGNSRGSTNGISQGGSNNMNEEPKPVQGGSDDFVRLSHVASIVVKEAPTTEKNYSEHKRRSTSRSSSPVPDTSSSRGSRDGRGRFSSRTRSTGGAAAVPADDMDGDDDAASDYGPMDKILKSPYEPNQNAEKGIKIFTDMKNLLAENHDDNFRSVCPQATKLFGPTNAWCLVRTNALIFKSGMVYSQEWLNGNIRGNLVGKIPKRLLLLCLVSKRFAKANEQLLGGVIRDLEVFDVVKEGLKKWDLDDEFRKVATCPKRLVFLAKKRDCLKCEIFVARTFSCMEAFKIEKMDDEMLAKIKTCLRIMEEHMSDPGGSFKKKRKEPEELLPPPAEANAAPAPKKRRGRPPKNRASIDTIKSDPAENTPQQSDSEDIDIREDVVSGAGAVSGSSATRSRRSANSNGNKSSLEAIVARFEQQHREMGEMYRQMGETLAELKSRIEESRESTVREIRSELLQEVQKTIMSSFQK